MDPQTLSKLVRSIKNGNCILFLGPDLACTTINGNKKSLRRFFADNIADYDPNNPIDNGQKPERIFQEFCFYTNDCEWTLRSEAIQFYQKYDYNNIQQYHIETNHSLFRNLASLPFKIVINTGLDRFFAHSVPVSCTEKYYNFNKKMVRDADGQQDFDNNEIDVENVTKPLIYNLYGSISDFDSLVLTEDNLVCFLNSIVSQTPPFPNGIKYYFQKSEHTFLFLGFGFDNWHLRILLHVLEKQNIKKPAFSIEVDNIFQKNEYQNAIYFFKNKHNIDFCSEDIEKFTKRLIKKFNNPHNW